MTNEFSRRRFVRGSAALAAAVGASSLESVAAEEGGTAFASAWGHAPDRVWIGPEYWTNPLQDWRLAGGRVECTNVAADRSVHLLTRAVGRGAGTVQMSVRIGRLSGTLAGGKGSAGFRVGMQGQFSDYRNALTQRKGLDAGVTAQGGPFIGDMHAAKAGEAPLDRESVELRLLVESKGDACTVTLAAHDAADGKELAKVAKDGVPNDRIAGGVALVANFGDLPAGAGPRAQQRRQDNAAGAGNGAFWFADWRVEGSRLERHDERAFGPVLFNHYTLGNGGILKMTAQMPPIGAGDAQAVRLQVKNGAGWKTIAEEKIHPLARTAVFRVEKWNDKADVPYRIAYALADAEGKAQDHFYEGVVRKDPVDRAVITVADVSCNTHQAFPNTQLVASMAKLNPDVLAFVGDQFYESSGGYGTVRKPLDVSALDYLRKWYLHGWTWRELTRDRPSLCLPDDHDVYQGNVFGEGGEPQHGTQEMGGYELPGPWVNIVHRTMTSHHQDAFDATPIKQGIVPYYGVWTYGRVSFAVLADRMFKSGPEGKVPPTGDRGDHVKDPNWDPKTADVPGVVLLGDRQLEFVREWAADWRGADMKAVISQTLFTGMATTHGGQREVLRADFDANGWPQTPRNQALREIRKCFAPHIAGDQHLPAVVHYGVDAHGDGPVAFAGPAVNVGYPRWFEPKEPGKNRKPGAPENTGQFADAFGHPMTVLAVANGAVAPRKTVMEQLADRSSGIGLVRLDKAKREITFECWPILADVSAAKGQFAGWPVTVSVMENYGRAPSGHLPELHINGADAPVVQVIYEKTGEVIYTLRIAGKQFRPHVFEDGKYTVTVSRPETGSFRQITGLMPGGAEKMTIEI